MSSKVIQSDGLFPVCSSQQVVSRSFVSSKLRSMIIAMDRLLPKAKYKLSLTEHSVSDNLSQGKSYQIMGKQVRNFTVLT